LAPDANVPEEEEHVQVASQVRLHQSGQVKQRRHGCRFHVLSPWQPGGDAVRYSAKPPAPKLFAENAILFAEVFNRVLLLYWTAIVTWSDVMIPAIWI
jgi:hypothetical protein